MWSHICYGQVLLIWTYASQFQKPHSDEKDYFKEDVAFTDIIKNISRVNNVLQELISNYEQVQRIYNSEESMENDFSSDTEFDEVFKAMEDVKKKRGRYTFNSKTKSKENVNTGTYPATEMFWSDHDKTSVDSIEKSEVDSVNESKLSESKSDSSQMETKPNVKNKSKVIEPIESKWIKPKHKNIKPKQKREKITIKNTSIKKTVTFPKLKKIADMPKKQSKTPTKNSQKTLSDRNKKNNKKTNDRIEPGHIFGFKNITRKIKKIVLAEAFSPKTIWDEIMQNKPIRLQPHGKIIYGKKEGHNLDANLRSVNGKTALVIVTKNKKKENVDQSDSTEETITKEVFKTKVLRKAYGDACLRVVVKKCYKACKMANKAVCTRHSCKSELTEKFKNSSKTACVKEFRGIPSTKDTKSKGLRGEEAKYIDPTRVGYSAICLTETKPNRKLHILRNDTKSIPRHVSKIQILRDKYEEACRRASAKKCLSACDCAAKAACDSSNCPKDQKKSYSKYCKKQCQMAYTPRTETTSESESSSDTDSSSEPSE